MAKATRAQRNYLFRLKYMGKIPSQDLTKEQAGKEIQKILSRRKGKRPKRTAMQQYVKFRNRGKVVKPRHP